MFQMQLTRVMISLATEIVRSVFIDDSMQSWEFIKRADQNEM